MSNRIKLPKSTVYVPETREQAEEAVRVITTLKIRERKLKSEMDAKLTEVKKRYEEELSGLAEKITPAVESIHAWAERHPEDFGGKKSLPMLHGVIGWRTTPPSLKPLKGFTWPAVLERLLGLGRREYIRSKEEVNKEALLAARESEDLKGMYVQVIQDDEFFVEPAITETENRQVKE